MAARAARPSRGASLRPRVPPAAQAHHAAGSVHDGRVGVVVRDAGRHRGREDSRRGHPGVRGVAGLLRLAPAARRHAAAGQDGHLHLPSRVHAAQPGGPHVHVDVALRRRAEVLGQGAGLGRLLRLPRAPPGRHALQQVPHERELPQDLHHRTGCAGVLEPLRPDSGQEVEQGLPRHPRHRVHHGRRRRHHVHVPLLCHAAVRPRLEGLPRQRGGHPVRAADGPVQLRQLHRHVLRRLPVRGLRNRRRQLRPPSGSRRREVALPPPADSADLPSGAEPLAERPH
mmetsp:Transcript_6899/g.18554  ORF Transcript_6899/g.18554 Transcript_6899/m.18554 type:complete len:284 (-) Transcript_6899:389-1240(-)